MKECQPGGCSLCGDYTEQEVSAECSTKITLSYEQLGRLKTAVQDFLEAQTSDVMAIMRALDALRRELRASEDLLGPDNRRPSIGA